MNQKVKAKFQVLNFKSAFTLLELLVYVGVLAIVAAVLVSFIVWSVHSNIKTQVMRETLANARGAVNRMSYEIRAAQSIYFPTTTSTQLSLETLNYLPEGELSSYLDFFLCGSQLCLKKESQEPLPLTSAKVEIKNLKFSQLAAVTTSPSIQIALTAAYKNPQDLSEYRVQVNVTSTASLRSYSY